MAMAASLSSSSLPLFKNVQMGSFSLKNRLACLRISASNYSSSDESVLHQAAKHTVDTYIKNGMIIGLGFGQASDMAIQYLGRQLRSGALKDIVGIPMSVASASEAAKAGIPLDSYQENSQSMPRFYNEYDFLLWLIGDAQLSLNEVKIIKTDGSDRDVHYIRFMQFFFTSQIISSSLYQLKILNNVARKKKSSRTFPKIDFAFDDADVMEEGTLVAVIGRRKLQDDDSIRKEKSILKSSKKLVFMMKESQYKDGLEGSIPVLVQSLNWMETAEEIDDLFLGDAEVWRRPSIGEAGPMGGDFPLLTREGHNVLDVIFTSPIQSLAAVAENLDKIDGVVDHGVISKLPCTAVIASESRLRVVDNLQSAVVEGV